MGQSKQQKQRTKAKKAIKKSTRAKTKHHTPIPLPQVSILNRLPAYKRNTRFTNFADAIKNTWNQTYLIARGRPVGENQMRIASLGTGFLCGKQRLLTCAHCVINDEVDEPMAKHQDGDVYFFVARNGNGNFHTSNVTTIKLDESLFVYPEQDAAIFYMPDSFYTDGTKIYKHPEEYLELSNTSIDIGEDVGVIGYPFQKLSANTEQAGLDTSGVIVRVDKGVINTGYRDAASNLLMYEFTMNFNPGNSGGPIIQPSNGKVVAWVKGFNSTAMEIKDGESKTKIYAHYSMGIATTNLSEIAKEHKLAF